jgi:ATP-dependent helicase/nuclease subunit B
VDNLGKQKDGPDTHELSANAWAALESLVSAYENPDKGYLSRARPFRQGDISGNYDHLARVMEWSLDDDDSEDAA